MAQTWELMKGLSCHFMIGNEHRHEISVGRVTNVIEQTVRIARHGRCIKELHQSSDEASA